MPAAILRQKPKFRDFIEFYNNFLFRSNQYFDIFVFPRRHTNSRQLIWSAPSVCKTTTHGKFHVIDMNTDTTVAQSAHKRQFGRAPQKNKQNARPRTENWIRETRLLYANIETVFSRFEAKDKSDCSVPAFYTN